MNSIYPVFFFMYIRGITNFYIEVYYSVQLRSFTSINKKNLIIGFLDIWKNDSKVFFHNKVFFSHFIKKLKKASNIVKYDLQTISTDASERILKKKFFLTAQYFLFFKKYVSKQSVRLKIRYIIPNYRLILVNILDFDFLIEDTYGVDLALSKKRLLCMINLLNYSNTHIFNKIETADFLKKKKKKNPKLYPKIKKLGEGFLLDFKKTINNLKSNFVFLLYSLYFISLTYSKKKMSSLNKLLFNKKELVSAGILSGKLTNFTPFQVLEEEIKTNVKKRFFVEQYLPLNLHINQYLTGFFEDLTKKKIYLKVKEIYKKKKRVKLFLKKMAIDNFYWQKIIGTNFYLIDMLNVLHFSLLFKDLTLLNEWFCKSMTRLNLKKHKIFLRLFKYLLLKYDFFFLISKGISGFKFDIRGKVGVAGNSKKRHFFFYIGRTSFAKKNLRLDYQQGLVYTNTGVLGSTMILSY